MGSMVESVVIPRIALIGGGIMTCLNYIPKLREMSHSFILKTIWSLDEESATAAVELVRDFSPNVECKWGESGLEEIIQDVSIQGVAVVLPAQVQVDISLRFLRAGKHVLQEKPAAISNEEAETAISCYKTMPRQPIWAIAENFRFENGFLEARKFINDIGDILNIHVVAEAYVNSSNPYFPSPWRRTLRGGFMMDMNVHFVAGLRLLVGSEISTVSALTRHVNTTLPPPDNVCALFQLENGCHGVYVMTVSSVSPKVYWRIDGTKGVLQVERCLHDGQLSFEMSIYSADGNCQRTIYPFSGVKEELKSFIHDVTQASKKVNGSYEANPLSSYVESARDLAVVEAMLESSAKNGAMVSVKKF